MFRTQPLIRTAFVVCAIVAVASGCRLRQTTRHPTPAAGGLNTRDVIDPVAQADSSELIGIDRFRDDVTARAARLKAELLKDAPPGQRERNVLCLSGGGSYGAYSAGVLCGWTERGDRPCFDVVTGISTGSLVSPFAFLGPKYDQKLKEFYTTITNDDIFKKRFVRGVFGAEAFADTAPLRKLIGSVITPELMEDLTAAHLSGRRLLVGTTEEEGSRFVQWDIGAIATRNGPGDRDLIIDVLLGSAAIPGVFPSSKIDVYVDGKCYTERHQDGGVSQGVFFHPPYVPPEQRNKQTLNLVGTNVYVIVAGKIYADPEVVQPSALSGAGRAATSVLSAQLRGDLQRMWTYCTVSGMSYNLTAVPPEFRDIGSAAEFDPKTMSRLFQEGQRVIASSTPWRTLPPFLDPNQGEVPQARWGRHLNFQPLGPQLPIPAPKKKKVQPLHPDAVAPIPIAPIGR